MVVSARAGGRGEAELPPPSTNNQLLGTRIRTTTNILTRPDRSGAGSRVLFPNVMLTCPWLSILVQTDIEKYQGRVEMECCFVEMFRKNHPEHRQINPEVHVKLKRSWGREGEARVPSPN